MMEQKITITQLAAVLGKSVEMVRRNIKRGIIPPSECNALGSKTACWKLSTVFAWNPAVAKRLKSLLDSNTSSEVF